ncbi:SPOSA6832_02398, partial [Sporobolomyces salmonicolor]
MKIGAWGACSRPRNKLTEITRASLVPQLSYVAPGLAATRTVGQEQRDLTRSCTSHQSGFTFNFVPNNTADGINQFPLVEDDATLLGTNPADADSAIFIIGPSATSVYWVHVVGGSPLPRSPPSPFALTNVSPSHSTAAILAILTVLSLVLPPSYLGSEDSRLFALQKSGVVTILLALASLVLTFVAFVCEIAVAVPAAHRLNAIDGIEGKLVSPLRDGSALRRVGSDTLRCLQGNVQWFVLPCFIVMLPALASVVRLLPPFCRVSLPTDLPRARSHQLLRASQPHQYSDL